MYAHAPMSVFVCVYVCVCVCVWECLRLCVCVCACMRVCVHMCRCIHCVCTNISVSASESLSSSSVVRVLNRLRLSMLGELKNSSRLVYICVLCVCVHTCMCTCGCTCMRTCVCVCVHVRVRVHLLHLYICTFVLTQDCSCLNVERVMQRNVPGEIVVPYWKLVIFLLHVRSLLVHPGQRTHRHCHQPLEHQSRGLVQCTLGLNLGHCHSAQIPVPLLQSKLV